MSRRKQVTPRHVEESDSIEQTQTTTLPTDCHQDHTASPDTDIGDQSHAKSETVIDIPVTTPNTTSLDYHKRLYVARNTHKDLENNNMDKQYSDDHGSYKEEMFGHASSTLPKDDDNDSGEEKVCDDMKKNIEDIVSELDKEIENAQNLQRKVSVNNTEKENNMCNNDDEMDDNDDTGPVDGNDEHNKDDPSCNNNINNVKLETLKNTRVAVAQIVENNLPSSDMVPSLMQTIYTLWQQQMMQCHMLEVVRQHLVKIARDRNIPLPSLPEMANQMMNSQPSATQHPELDDSINSPVSPGCSISEIDDLDEEDQCFNGSVDILKNSSSSSGLHNSYHQQHQSRVVSMSAEQHQQHIDSTSPSAAAEAPRIDKEGRSDIFGTTTDHRSRCSMDDPGLRHKCHICHKAFVSENELQLHARSHTGDHSFECDVCHSKFGNREELKIHYERHLYGNRESSQMCRLQGVPHMDSSQASFPKSDSINSTNYNFNNRPQPLMVISPSNDRNIPADRFHMSPRVETSSSLRPQFPPICSSSPSNGPAPSIPLPSSHHPMSSPFGSPPLGMPPPGMGTMPPFYRQSILPVEEEDDDQMEQFMEIDKSETSKLEAMVKNIETKLTDPNQCAICKRILSCKSALQMHYRTHTGERPFKCKICGRAFTTKGNLKTHMGVHRMKPPMRPMHHCPICQKQFTNPLVLQQHMQNHSHEVPRMFPGGPPGMMTPSPFLSMGGLPMMPPHIMSKFPTYMPPNFGLDLRKPSYYNEDDLSDNGEFDDNSEFGRSEPDNLSEMGENSMKRGRIEEDEEEIVKRQKSESDNETTDDEEVPREQSERITNTSTPKSKEHFSEGRHFPLVERKDIPLPPHMNFPSPYIMNNEHNNITHPTSLSALEERVKALEQIGKDTIDTSLTQEIKHKLEGVHRTSVFPFISDRSPDARPGLSPGARSEAGLSTAPSDYSSTADFDRQPAKSTSPAPVPSVLKPYNFMDLQHPMNFSAGRPGMGTTCDVCFKTFACKSALEIHYRSHTKEKPFRCTLCDRGFSTRGNLKQHLLTHKIRDLQEAGIDASEYNSLDSTDVQLYREPEMDVNMPHHEPHSPKTSPDKPEGGYHPDMDGKSETKHMASPHHVTGHTDSSRPVNPVQPLQREQMDDNYMNSTNLRHMCQVCQKPFSSSSALQIHMRTHTGERPFKCTVCGKGFTTKGNLKVHMSTHDDRNSFTRRGRRMSMDGLPRFDGFQPPLPGFPHSALHLKPGPEFFIPRFPYMGGFPNGFMPRPNEIPVIQSSGISPVGLMSPGKRENPFKSGVYPGSRDNESKHIDNREQPRQITQAS